MNFARVATLAVIIGASMPFTACSRPSKPAWAASLAAVGQQFELIQQAHAQGAGPSSPEAQMTYQNMQALWQRMSRMQSGMMNGRGMMMHGGMMGGPRMMRFNELNQQMLSYCMGMQQMMRQAGNMDMAARYGRMAGGMRTLLSQLPQESSTKAGPQANTAAPRDGAATFAANCAGCHGADGAGLSGVFPPVNGSSVAAGDTQVLAKIVLHGLQGPITVGGTQYSGFMPAFENTLSDAQIAAALSYVRSLSNNGTGGVDAAAVQAARSQTASHSQAWTAQELGLQ